MPKHQEIDACHHHRRYDVDDLCRDIQSEGQQRGGCRGHTVLYGCSRKVSTSLAAHGKSELLGMGPDEHTLEHEVGRQPDAKANRQRHLKRHPNDVREYRRGRQVDQRHDASRQGEPKALTGQSGGCRAQVPQPRQPTTTGNVAGVRRSRHVLTVVDMLEYVTDTCPAMIRGVSTTSLESPPECRICAGQTSAVGVVHGRFSRRDYRLARCPSCGYAFIVDPWLDFAEIYNDRYYEGRGADPLVDYRFELDHPEHSIRRYEWDGLATVVARLLSGLEPSRRWLDYGCGNGCLVRHLRSKGVAEALGFDEGSIVTAARARGIPVLTAEDLTAQAGTFDVVTAIEVIEHTLDPLAELGRMRSLLRPGGLLFLTTGNAQPYADRLTRWRYVLPEIHISFFEPRTLIRAMAETGFRAEQPSLGSGFDEIMKFKVLKNLRVRRRSWATDILPSRLIGPIADRMVKLSEQPVGWAS
jgi:2-polyprenyl-3-methyl-5-hydroxy-6-metoxy-1,4-benzoquinol methylase